MWGISYWIVPLFSGVIWLAMLLGMLLTWVVDGEPHYSSMNENQHIAYISNIGAEKLKPMFIAMSAVTVVSFDLVFIFERWLRHSGRLLPNTSWFQKICSIICIIAALAGAAGLILLSIFDTKRHPRLHDVFLVLFIAGYIVSAIAICIEYQRLGVHHRQTLLHISFWVKIGFIIIELGLAIAFGIMNRQARYNLAAILEWIISLIYTFYVWSFFVDFIPAVRTKHHQSRETAVEMAEGGSQDRLYEDHRNLPPVANGYPPRGATASPAAAGHF